MDMDKQHLSQHISHQFNEELDEVMQNVLVMGGIVEEQLNKALRALSEYDITSAEQVIRGDDKVNQYHMRIDEECAKIIAKRQPAASDLRLVLGITKAIADLERSGDESVKIARMAEHLASPKNVYTSVNKQADALLHLGQYVQEMFHKALDAFARLDAAAAVNIAREEKKVDREYNALLRQLITYMMEDPRSISQVLDAIWAARALERIGDHASNLCEYIVYMVQGKDIRHSDIEEIAQQFNARS